MNLPVLLAAPFIAPTIAHADQVEPIKVTVASVSGRSVFLDKGKAAGITPGLRVRLYPSGGARLDLIVADATKNSARVDVPEGVELPLVGTPGDLDLPEPVKPAVKPPAKPGQRKEDATPATPAHPPWQRKDDARTPDQPLLAPAFARPAKDRPMQVHGQIFSQLLLTFDTADGRDSTYDMERLGARVTITNPFGDGGRIQFAGDFDRRAASVEDGQDDVDTNINIDRLSYAVGGEQYSPYRVEGGRFISIYLPEIGLMDGVGAALLLESGLKLGVGIGAYPEPSPDRQSGDELGFHIFADYQSKSPNLFNATLGYQKTWHQGSADRDVLIGRINARPTKDLWLFGSAKVDIYTDGDPVKPAGPQLTEAWAQARYMFTKSSGASLAYSHYSWADTLQNEFRYIPADLIRTGRIDRFDVSAWTGLAEDVRLTGRANYWTDQRGEGYGTEGTVTWDKVFDTSLSAVGSIFYNEASYTDGAGFRAELRPLTGDFQWFLGYEFYRYRFTGLISDEEYYIRHTLRAGLSWQVGRWYYNVSLDRYLGDVEDVYSLGAFVEYRF